MMAVKYWCPSIFLACVMLTIPTYGQRNKTKKTSGRETVDAAQHEQKVRDIVAFLQYMLNTLGSNATGARDKEVLITESFSKIFRDEKVQVEDDLVEGRTVITNKDVVAYLKDVDFFFRDVKFEFDISKIESNTLSNGLLFYRVVLTRNLSGTTSDGKVVNNTMPRYIEINFDPESQDLKIVSIYTNEFDEKEALTNWWGRLSFEWQSIFRERTGINKDSLDLDDIKTITAITDLDLSENTLIQSIEPLGALAGLYSLNISGTAVPDLVSIRNLTSLEHLDISNTPVEDLSPLKYAATIKSLNISGTHVTDISVLSNMIALKELDLSKTAVINYSPIGELDSLSILNLSRTSIADASALGQPSNLKELNLSGTQVVNLDALSGFSSLKRLIIDSTRVVDLAPLANADSLEVVSANHTPVADLRILGKLAHLKRVYCDQSKITREHANAFMASHPGILVVYDSRDLNAWWSTLPEVWQELLSNTARTGDNPTKEELVVVTNLDSVNVSGNRGIKDLEPLRRLEKLRVVIANGSGITSIEPLEHHEHITLLDISGTGVTDLTPISSFRKLKVLRADQSKIQNIEPLHGMTSLTIFYADQTYVHDLVAREFLARNRDCLIVYKTNHLNRWWRNITGYWIKAFHQQMPDTTATRENLHRLAERESITVTDIPVRDMSPLSEFVQLKEFRATRTSIREIAPLENLFGLETLEVSENPLRQIEALAEFTSLRELNISGTPIDRLDVLAGLSEVRLLDVSGTQIRKLNPLEGLRELHTLDCSNTGVRSLDPVATLSLKTLRCYNTLLSSRKVERFAELNPECKIVFYR